MSEVPLYTADYIRISWKKTKWVVLKPYGRQYMGGVPTEQMSKCPLDMARIASRHPQCGYVKSKNVPALRHKSLSSARLTKLLEVQGYIAHTKLPPPYSP